MDAPNLNKFNPKSKLYKNPLLLWLCYGNYYANKDIIRICTKKYKTSTVLMIDIF